MSKITIDDFEIPDSDIYNPTSQNAAYDRILQLSYEQSAYAPRPTRCEETTSSNSESNKYFTIDINQLCKSLHCKPFNFIVSTTEKDPKYFSHEQLKVYEEKASQSREEFKRGSCQKYVNSKDIKMFEGLLENNPSVTISDIKKESSDNVNMNDWLDDLLN